MNKKIQTQNQLESKVEGWCNHFCLPSYLRHGYPVTPEYIAKFACEKGYFPSVNRALYKDGKLVGFKPVTTESKTNARNQAARLIEETIMNHYNSENKFHDFDIYDLIDKVRTIYHENGITYYTYGNAQKFVSMAMKYFNCFMIYSGFYHLDDIDPLGGYNYSVVDGIMIKNEKNARFNASSWSKCDDINTFRDYQTQLNNLYKDTYDNLAFYEMCSWKQN